MVAPFILFIFKLRGFCNILLFFTGPRVTHGFSNILILDILYLLSNSSFLLNYIHPLKFSKYLGLSWWSGSYNDTISFIESYNDTISCIESYNDTISCIESYKAIMIQYHVLKGILLCLVFKDKAFKNLVKSVIIFN